jgi:hypothetical protein
VDYVLRGGFKMYQLNEIEMAQKIIQLDRLRDEIFEELMELLGSDAYNLLRTIQNQSTYDGR